MSSTASDPANEFPTVEIARAGSLCDVCQPAAPAPRHQHRQHDGGRMVATLVGASMSRDLLTRGFGNSYNRCRWGCDEGLDGNSERNYHARS